MKYQDCSLIIFCVYFYILSISWLYIERSVAFMYMPRVRNADDARLEIDALRKERVLMMRLRQVLARERQRISANVKSETDYLIPLN